MRELASFFIVTIVAITYLLMVLLMIQEWPSFVNKENIAYYAIGLPAAMMFGMLAIYTLQNKDT